MSTLATLPAITIASPAIADATEPHSVDFGGALQRAAAVVDLLRTRYVRDGWSIDEAAAERALAWLRRAAEDPARGDDDRFIESVVKFCEAHGQSLDWILRGDPGGMVCMLAAGSPRAAKRTRVSETSRRSP